MKWLTLALLGALIIDAYDGRSGATVWHGSGQAELKAEQPIDDERLASGVERMLLAFAARTELASQP